MNSDADSHEKGKLYLVATPIGNLQDITLRALETLRQVDYILAEDTRHARILLNAHHIQKPLLSYYDYNREQRTPQVLQDLESGKNVALITDAGTPGISDPGYYVVKKAIEKGITIVPIPGATALIAALAASGLPTDSFVFCGFVPRKAGKRQKLLAELADLQRTVILSESPHRVLATLEDLRSVFGAERQVVVARELTKIYEEFLRGRLAEVLDDLKARKNLKGEYVILVAGKEA